MPAKDQGRKPLQVVKRPLSGAVRSRLKGFLF
jgi:hypothetical protein